MSTICALNSQHGHGPFSLAFYSGCHPKSSGAVVFRNVLECENHGGFRVSGL